MYAILEGLKYLIKGRTAAFIVTILLGLSITISTVFLRLTIKLNESSGFFSNNMGIEAFILDGTNEKAISGIYTILLNNSAVENVIYISKDSAAVIFKEEIGEDINELIAGENPLPASFKINLKNEYLSPVEYDSLLNVFSAIDKISEVVPGSRIVPVLLKYRGIIRIAHLISGSVIVLLTGLLIINLIRLSINNRKKTIEILKLIGAKNSFIRGPFIAEAVFIGVTGYGFSVLILFLIRKFLNYSANLDMQLPMEYYSGMITSAVAFSVLSTVFALRKYLRSP